MSQYEVEAFIYDKKIGTILLKDGSDLTTLIKTKNTKLF